MNRVLLTIKRWPSWLKYGLVYGTLLAVTSFNFYEAYKTHMFYKACEGSGGFVFQGTTGRACALIPEQNIIPVGDPG